VFDAIRNNLLTPMPLFFALGLFATLVRSELKMPEPLYVGLVLSLLAAIGLKGGAEIKAASQKARTFGYHRPLWSNPAPRSATTDNWRESDGTPPVLQ